MTHAAMLHRFRPGGARSLGLSEGIGLVGGCVLPLVAAAVYRTYQLTVAPGALEITRQLGVLFIAAELATFFLARRRGLNVSEIMRDLPRWARAALLLFLTTFWISSAFVSRMVPFSLMLSLSWIVQLLFAGSLYYLVAGGAVIDLRAIARGFVGGLIGLTIVTAVHFAAFPAFLIAWPTSKSIDWSSAIPGFISSRLFGSWCSAVLALLTGLCWRPTINEGDRRRLYLMLAFVFCLTFWTGTRAALVGWAITVPVALLLTGRPASRTVYTRLPFYLIAAAGVALLVPPYGGAFTFVRWGTLATADTAASGRLTLWVTALRVAARYPLLGSGAGSSWWLVPLKGFYHVQPHNMVVQFLLNWGLIPTIPALLLLGGAAVAAHRAARRHPDLLPIILPLDCLLVMSMFDGMLHFAQFIMLILGCLAICLGRAKATSDASAYFKNAYPCFAVDKR